MLFANLQKHLNRLDLTGFQVQSYTDTTYPIHLKIPIIYCRTYTTDCSESANFAVLHILTPMKIH